MGVAGCIANVLQSCGGSGGGGPAPATQGTAGTPGTWLPPGSNPPSDATQATALGITAAPISAWTLGQYVQGRTAGAPGEMFWNGTAWNMGRSVTP